MFNFSWTFKYIFPPWAYYVIIPKIICNFEYYLLKFKIHMTNLVCMNGLPITHTNEPAIVEVGFSVSRQNKGFANILFFTFLFSTPLFCNFLLFFVIFFCAFLLFYCSLFSIFLLFKLSTFQLFFLLYFYLLLYFCFSNFLLLYF